MRHRLTLLLSLLLFPLVLSAAPKEGQRAITEASLRAHVEFLASPELGGRDDPGEGSRIARRYLATRFREYGLQELPGAPGYYQDVPLVVSRTDYEQSRMAVRKGEQTQEFVPNREVFFFPRGGEDADLTAPVLLAGYGIQAPEFGWDDFAGADPAGKFLLIFNREPQDTDTASVFNGRKSTKYSNPQVKVRIARELGAAGLLIIQPPNNGLPPIEETLDRHRRGMTDPIIQLAAEKDAFPVFYLKESAARALLSEDFDLAAYQRGLDENFRPDPRLLEAVDVTLKIRFKEVQETGSANVVGYYPGKTEEAVVLLAHHDHMGAKDGRIWYGADDNASGVAGLLAVAEALASAGQTPQRGVIFLSTAVEEDGTLGALHFTRRLPFPAEKIVAAVNLDEIGRDASTQFRALQDSTITPEPNSLMMFYSGQTPLLADLARRENKDTGLNLILEPVLHFSGSSDHIHFHDRQIPSVFLFTGFHADYHTPQDIPEKLNYEKMTRITRFTYGLIWNLAQARPRPVFDTTIREVQGTGRRYGS
ncbi:MAG: M20/M25/M40 family metallo-hydrolase [Candidatus Zixiibacteriota bacterium]|nr:MAG: M20/M25/M40 family metallo-hydrolase [candidate division Zixibacteria bacterium]